MEWKKGEYLITDDQSQADIDFVHTSLNSTYWAENRPRAVVEKSLKKSDQTLRKIGIPGPLTSTPPFSCQQLIG